MAKPDSASSIVPRLMNLPSTLERHTLGFLSIIDLPVLLSVSRPSSALLVDHVRALQRVVWPRHWDSSPARAAGLSLLRRCQSLALLNFERATGQSAMPAWLQRFAAEVIERNAGSLRHVSLPDQLSTMASLRALAGCSRLTAFAAVGVRDGSPENYSRAVLELFARCPAIVSLNVGSGRRGLSPQVVAEILAKGE